MLLQWQKKWQCDWQAGQSGAAAAVNQSPHRCIFLFRIVAHTQSFVKEKHELCRPVTVDGNTDIHTDCSFTHSFVAIPNIRIIAIVWTWAPIIVMNLVVVAAACLSFSPVWLFLCVCVRLHINMYFKDRGLTLEIIIINYYYPIGFKYVIN